MKRLLFYLFKMLAFCSRVLSYNWYRKLIVHAHKSQGVCFEGVPEYIHTDAYLDASGGLTIGKDVVISTNVVILSHDWSFLKREKRKHNMGLAFSPVYIGENTFIGAGVVVLPGTHIGKSTIIGAGAVIKGDIPDYAIIVGNPAKQIGDTRD